MSKLILSIIFILFFVITSCDNTKDGSAFDFQGTVVDESTGAGLENVLVSLDSTLKTFTDKNG